MGRVRRGRGAGARSARGSAFPRTPPVVKPPVSGPPRTPPGTATPRIASAVRHPVATAGRRAHLRRVTRLLLPGLLLAALAPDGAGAQERRVFVVSPGPPLLAAPAPPTAREENRRWLCPNGGAPVRGRPGRCDGRGTRPTVTASNTAPGPGADPGDDAAGWDAGVPQAPRRQLPCPAGTVAAEARANPGTFRCVPG